MGNGNLNREKACAKYFCRNRIFLGEAFMKPRMFFSILMFLTFATPNAFGLEVKQLVGNYELVGVMEMAGGLILNENQKYVAGFSYGAADWEEEGSWKIEGDEVILEGSHLKVKNKLIPSPFLPAGTRFKFKDGKLTSTDPTRKLVFINPNKTPSPSRKTADSAGEGRMRVHGKVVKLDSEVLVVKTKECIQFDVKTLSDSVLKMAKQKMGKMIDVEIPYSSIIGGGSCP
jgi:hypothetical protein